MKLKVFLPACLIGTLFALIALMFSKHGLMDFLRMQDQIKKTQAHIHELEESNKELRRKVDLLSEGGQRLLEDQARSALGYVKSDELIYLESN